MAALAEIIGIKEGVEADYLKRPGVTGVDVGFKYVGGQRTEEIAIRVLVAQKKKTVAPGEKIPATVGGVTTDVIERTFHLQQRNRMKLEDITLQADTTNYNPLKGGISIGPCRSVGGFIYAGTLGAIVKDNATNNPMLLSNFHVMCIDNGWHVGDTMVQPSLIDTGACPANVVGTLQRATLSGSVDGAVCSLSGRSYSCEIADIGAVTGTASVILNQAVRKRGRTTGLTYGLVDSVSLSVNIDYGDGIGVRTLTNQIGIRPDTSHNAQFGDHGDSGSVVVDDTIHIVGLHFAGSSDGHGIANPIAAVLTALNISVCVTPVKNVLKDLKDGKVEVKEHKHEKIEIKEVKEGKREKVEVKEHKHEKVEIKEVKEGKHEKIEIKDKHEKTEIKDIKEGKHEKVEIKDKHEKLELKEGKREKPEKFEIEGLKRVGDTKFFETGDPGPFKPPAGPGLPGPGSVDERLARVEAALEQLTTFITSEMRPNLSSGALTQEADYSGDISAMSQQLQKDAADALQTKTDFDNKVSDR